MGMMTNELTITSARTRGAMMSSPLQNARTLGASRLELGKSSLIRKTDQMLEQSAYLALTLVVCTREYPARAGFLAI